MLFRSWGYLGSFMLVGIIVCLHTLLTIKSYENIDVNYMFCGFYIVVCYYILWYCFTVFRCNHYDIELREDAFTSRVLFAKEVFTKEVKYSEVVDMFMITMQTKSAIIYKIVKIKTKEHGIIRIRVNELSDQDEDYILYNLQRKTKKYIKDKDTRSFFL